MWRLWSSGVGGTVTYYCEPKTEQRQPPPHMGLSKQTKHIHQQEGQRGVGSISQV